MDTSHGFPRLHVHIRFVSTAFCWWLLSFLFAILQYLLLDPPPPQKNHDKAQINDSYPLSPGNNAYLQLVIVVFISSGIHWKHEERKHPQTSPGQVNTNTDVHRREYKWLNAEQTRVCRPWIYFDDSHEDCGHDGHWCDHCWRWRQESTYAYAILCRGLSRSTERNGWVGGVLAMRRWPRWPPIVVTIDTRAFTCSGTQWHRRTTWFGDA